MRRRLSFRRGRWQPTPRAYGGRYELDFFSAQQPTTALTSILVFCSFCLPPPLLESARCTLKSRATKNQPENILVDAKGHLCLADMGLSKILGTGENAVRTSTVCGTRAYLAPEMVLRKPYGMSVDFWQFGCFVYELYAVSQPVTPSSSTYTCAPSSPIVLRIVPWLLSMRC